MGDAKRLSIALALFALSGFSLWGCAKGAEEAPARSRQEEVLSAKNIAEPSADKARQVAPVTAGRVGGRGGKGGPRKKMARPRPKRPQAANEKEAQKADSEQDEMQTQTRSWFPETFLFRPLILTDEKGQAQVEVRVPDRLTSWRVLALAHSRQGAQAGDLTTFLGTLPVYVEPIVPKVLRAGDVVRMPINLVNTTQEAMSAQLQVEARGVKLAGGSQTVALAPAGSAVRYATLRAGAPTQAKVFAKLAGKDAVLRSLEVVPLGRPVRQTHKGALAAPRVVKVKRPAGADAALGRVRLQVFPGALALLRSELSAAGGRGGGVAAHAFSLLLAGKAPGLMRALGGGAKAEKEDKEDAAARRDLTMLATQRVLRQARVLTMGSATLLAEAALAHPENAILSRLAKRAVAHIVDKQAPDGTCGGETGWSLQRLLVSTAECVRAAPMERKVAARAALAFARHVKRIVDPYTAAALLASGAVKGEPALALRKVLMAAIDKRRDGSKAIKLPKGVLRADGRRPSVVEATALAILALDGVKGAPLADLGATILAGYSPSMGWGDGRANLVCMKAALKVFREPMPAKIRIALQRDGKTVAEGTLSRGRAREVVVLEAAAGPLPKDGKGTPWKIIADPPLAGLGFALTSTDWVPWQKMRGRGGVELSVKVPTNLSVGKRGVLVVRAAAPSGRPLSIRLALPAGVQADRKKLDALVRRRVLTRYSLTDAYLDLFSPALPPAKVFAANVHVVPTLAGSVHSGASTLRVGRVEVVEPPAAWQIK